MNNLLLLLCLLCVCLSVRGQTIKNVKRIIGGEFAPNDRFHWTVSIKADFEQYKSAASCGASIIKSNGKVEWLLTAAHCILYKSLFFYYNFTNPTSWHARLGVRKVDFNYSKHEILPIEPEENQFKLFFQNIFEKNTKQSEEGKTPNYQDLHVVKVVVHPKYKPTNLEYDIALMKVESEIPVDKLSEMSTIDLPPRESEIGKWPLVTEECIVVGWGCTKSGGMPSKQAKLALLRIVDHATCKKWFNAEIGLNNDSEFCAGYKRKSYGICPGDSGSALACLYKGNYTVAGVVSAVHSRRPGEYPALFTNVQYFRDWIDSVINGE